MRDRIEEDPPPMTDLPPAEQAHALLSIARGKTAETRIVPVRLGARVRQIRQDRNWTLEEAAKRAGLARSTLSKIENEQMSPTYDAVQKLAQGLGIDVPQLFTPAETDRVTGRRAIGRAGQGTVHPTRTYEHELLVSELTAKKMLPYRTTVRARAFEDFGGWVRHDGEEFFLVLSGRLLFLTEFYEPVELSAGDTAYYDAGMGHCLISKSDTDAVVLWVTSL